MAKLPVVIVKIVGSGDSKMGLYLLGLVARIFHINLEIKWNKA